MRAHLTGLLEKLLVQERVAQFIGQLQRGVTISWGVPLIVVGILVGLHIPHGSLDRGTILAIAGLVLAILAVTVGLVAVLAQHLAEAYARALVEALFRQSTWRTTSIAEGVGIVLTVALALLRADLSAGAVAAVVLVASLIGSWSALTNLFRQFDPLMLIQLQERAAMDRLARTDDRIEAARKPSQAILSLIISGANKGDTDVVEGGMKAWSTILERYMSARDVYAGDNYLYWIYERCVELIEQQARESIGLVLPSIVSGAAALGVTVASHRNRVNPDVDEYPWLYMRMLMKVNSLAGASDRSVAGVAAADGATDVGLACITAAKFDCAQASVTGLQGFGLVNLEPATQVAIRASIGLSSLILAIAESESREVMRPDAAEGTVGALTTIVSEDRTVLGPAHFLVAPMSETNLPLLCQKLARARSDDDAQRHSRRDWDSLASWLSDACRTIFDNHSGSTLVLPDTVDTAGCIAVGFLALDGLESRELLLDVIERLTKWLTDLALTDRGWLRTTSVLASECLVAYEVSRREPGIPRLRAMVETMALRIASADKDERALLSPILRQLGATALYFGDDRLAETMAKATIPRPVTASTQGWVLRDEFDVSMGLPHIGLQRPGLITPEVPTYYLDPKLQNQFAALEQRARLRPKRQQ